jgi:hypothetical protein
VAAVDPRGSAVHSAKGTAMHAMRSRIRRIGVRGRVGDTADAALTAALRGREVAQQTFRIA